MSRKLEENLLFVRVHFVAVFLFLFTSRILYIHNGDLKLSGKLN